jgi:formyltetrahydrofolate hydrolase
VSKDSKACSTELSEKQLVPKYTVAVLASGSGTNLQAIIEKLHRKAIDETIVVDDDDELVQARIPIIEIAIVITDVKDAPAVKRAWTAGIPTAVIPFDRYDTHEAHDLHMAAAVNDLDIDLVVLAGYMRLLHPSFVKAFPQQDRQRSSRPVARVPGDHLHRGCPRIRCEGHGRDGALCRGGDGLGADHRPGAGAGG